MKFNHFKTWRRMFAVAVWLSLWTPGLQGANQAPVLQSIGDQSVPMGSLLSLEIQANDPDADLLSYGTASGVPIIFWASQPVKPDQTILATCGGTDATSTAELARLADDAPGSPLTQKPLPSGWQGLAPLSASARSVFVTVPANWTHGVYALRLIAGNVTGPTRLVNAPDPWFVQGDMGDTATPGGYLIVAGNCLEITGGSGPRVALVRNGAVVKTLSDPVRMTTSTGYALRYAVPANTPQGDYTLYVHNGKGGPAAWVKFSNFAHYPIETVTVRAFDPWPTTVFKLNEQPGANADQRFAAAIVKLKANGGGILEVPAGTHELNNRLLLPRRTLLKGAGMATSKLLWVSTPPISSPFSIDINPLLCGEMVYNNSASTFHTFSIEDLSLESTDTFKGQLVLRQGVSDPGWFRRVSIYVPTPKSLTAEFGSPTAFFLRKAANTLLDEVVLEATHYCLRGHEGISYLRFTNSTLNWSGMSVWFGSGSHNIVIKDNLHHLKGSIKENLWDQHGNPNPGFFFTTFNGRPYTRDLLWSNRPSTHESTFGTIPTYLGYSADGGTGIYFGGVQSVSGTQIQLSGPVADHKKYGTEPATYLGGIVQIMDGKGAGQWRYVIEAAPLASVVTVDRPWDIEPDGTSTIGINQMFGRLLMIDNDYSSEPLNQDYYMSLDSIKAGNRYGVDGTAANIASWTGSHYHGMLPNWHLQVIDNQVVKGPSTSFISMIVSEAAPHSEFPGVVGAGHVYRNNTNSSGNPLNIHVRSRWNTFADVLMEKNQATTVYFNKGSERISLESVVMRKNLTPSGGAPVTIPATIPPGVTVLP
jgi:hypothetical protein